MTAPSTPPKAASPIGEKPFLRFYHPTALRIKTLAVLTVIEQAADATKYRDTLADLVMELVDSGLEYYFVRALDVANVGFVVKQPAVVGLAGVKRVMGPVVHNVIGRMDQDQLRAVCRHIRQLME